ncbi:MAG: NUDIX domain-containing protein [Nanoarchaeota archaeon]
MPPSYAKAFIGVDAAIFTLHDHHLKILLHRREKEPFRGRWELPGGLVRDAESAEERIQSKLAELTGRDDLYFEQFHTFTAPDRDPRGRAVSVAYIALVCCDTITDFSMWHDCAALPSLAFDHRDIIASARAFLAANLDSIITKQFLPPRFPLNLLQEAYQIIRSERYDNRNFRKRMIASLAVEETKEVEQGVSHRPARLFRFKT